MSKRPFKFNLNAMDMLRLPNYRYRYDEVPFRPLGGGGNKPQRVGNFNADRFGGGDSWREQN